MTIDWHKPFELAGQMFLFLFGWSIVATIVLFAFALLLGFIGAFRTVIAKNKVQPEQKTNLTSVK